MSKSVSKTSEQSQSNQSTATTVALQTSPAERPEIANVVATDGHAGKGGTYVFDPETGKRTAAESPPSVSFTA